jgi:hypothetical protein
MQKPSMLYSDLGPKIQNPTLSSKKATQYYQNIMLIQKWCTLG